MFEELKKYSKIFVTGLARSGTRIATRMIAQDTGMDFIDETEWGVVDVPKLVHYDKYFSKFVVQATSLSFCISRFSREDTLIVFVKRDLNDIQLSWDRVRTKNLDSIKLLWKNPPKEALVSVKDRLFYWERQKPKIINLLEVEYESLKDHPLWVPKEKRDDFLWHQTRESQFKKEQMVEKL